MSAEASVGEIAGRLTKAQRGAVLAVTAEWQKLYPDRAELEDVRLIKHPLFQSHPMIGQGSFEYRLTPLGLLVKAHLNRPDAEKEME